MTTRFRLFAIGAFAFLALISGFFAFRLKFAFDFEQFFPKGDPDLAFFREFIRDFETDDNFLLVAVRREEGVFDQRFLQQFHDLSLECRDLPHVVQSLSLTKIGYPLRTPFGVMTSVPAIHLDNPARYDSDRRQVLRDERFVRNFITADGKTLVIYLKTIESIQLPQARELMQALDKLIARYDFEEYHYLGRPYFQKELVRMQQRELAFSFAVSGILVAVILWLVFRRFWGVVIALLTLGLGMLIFLGYLGLAGRELSALAALYPVLMIIVGTSDVIHLMTKYVDELRLGLTRRDAIRNTLRDVGLATFMTSFTTAIGFASLLSSRLQPIRDFGVNAAVGVLIAYVTAIVFASALLTWFRAEQIARPGHGDALWKGWMEYLYQFTRDKARIVTGVSIVVVLICAWGISRITTNYEITTNMPRGEKITEDFRFFERELSGFRPLEYAILVQKGYRADDFEVVREIDKIEGYLRQFPFVQAIGSITLAYKSINQMYGNNRPEAFRLPESEVRFTEYQRLLKRMPLLSPNVLVSKNSDKARITSRIADIGADSIKAFGQRTDRWIAANIDPSVIQVKRTGTGLIIDKNAEYVRRNLLQGLLFAIVLISGLMAIVFRDWRGLIIAFVPNMFPLLIAGALLGFLGIELEAGISIVFSVIFGIAVDDTIHVLSKFQLTRRQGCSVDQALYRTFTETGKPVVLTTVILFFGFLVMLFSIHPPSVYVGLLISVTLLSALIADLFVTPVLIRWLVRE